MGVDFAERDRAYVNAIERIVEFLSYLPHVRHFRLAAGVQDIKEGFGDLLKLERIGAASIFANISAFTDACSETMPENRGVKFDHFVYMHGKL